MEELQGEDIENYERSLSAKDEEDPKKQLYESQFLVLGNDSNLFENNGSNAISSDKHKNSM